MTIGLCKIKISSQVDTFKIITVLKLAQSDVGSRGEVTGCFVNIILLTPDALLTSKSSLILTK